MSIHNVVPPKVLDRAGLDHRALRVVRDVLSGLGSVAQVVAFAQNSHPPFQFTRKVAYADGSYDLVASRPADATTLAFSVREDGGIVLVSIWDRTPTAGELLVARIDARIRGSEVARPGAVEVAGAAAS